MHKVLTATAIMAALSIIGGCLYEKGQLDGAALLEERCGGCHSTSIPKNSRKSASEWRICIERMIGKGARLSVEEKRSLIEYLSRVYKP